ncbi:MAG: DUF3443 domain-containing protein [Nitrospirae bacterium]|nr:DUF3443 domain-containing protein [Nitrospirota bacterium]
MNAQALGRPLPASMLSLLGRLLARARLLPLVLLFSGIAGCGGGGGSSGPPAVYSNQVVVSLLSTQWNIPTVSVTLCIPRTNTCQTVDNILLDTGSVGLRISHSVLTLNLPPVTDGGEDVDECYQFSSGSVFGPVVSADVVLGGEPAAHVDVQISNTSLTPPSSCTQVSSVTSGGVNGILGVGYPFTQYDLGIYYLCSSSGCPNQPSCSNTQGSNGSFPCQVANPVFSFPTDNNGILLSFPSVPSSGAPPPVYGTLTFGLNTQSDNSLSGLTVYEVSANNSCGSSSSYLEASFTGGSSGSCAFLDSGSNGLFFGTTTFTVCNTYWYCPSSSPYCTSSPLAPISLILTGGNGTTGSFDLSVINESSIQNSSNIAWNDLAGPYGSNSTFDAGLPFFFGRTVAVGYQTESQNPFWAF